MIFAKLIENPEETALIPFILGTILSQDLDAIELALLARLISDVGDVVGTFAIIRAARDVAEAAKVTKEKDSTIKANFDNTQATIKELQQQNQYLLEQVWVLQKKMSEIQNKES